jgi:hypothetical protein
VSTSGVANSFATKRTLAVPLVFLSKTRREEIVMELWGRLEIGTHSAKSWSRRPWSSDASAASHSSLSGRDSKSV